MDRPISIMLLAAALAAAQPTSAFAGTPPDCGIPAAGDADATPIRSRAELDAWLEHCPSPLDVMTPSARTRFLDGLHFNERGLTGFPYAELEEALTADEFGKVARLFGLDLRIGGLRPEEAARLRAHAPTEDTSEVERRYNQFHRERMSLEHEADGATIGPAMLALYASLFPLDDGADPGQAADGYDLGLIYRAATDAAFYSDDPRLVEIAWNAYARLSSQGLATRARATRMMRLLLATGRIDDARTLARDEPDHGLPLLPPTRDESGGRHDTSVWDLDAAPDALVRRHVPLSPARIIVRASLGCQFSRDAATAIADDPELGPLFREHAVWLAPPAELIGYEQLRSWNREHPTTPLHVAVDWADWPMFHGREGTPGFYVFRDGELVASVTTGWPSEGNRDAVLAALREAGLVEAP